MTIHPSHPPDRPPSSPHHTHTQTNRPTDQQQQQRQTGVLKKEFITHTIAYNYKVVSDPPGLPIIFEEVTCQVSV